MLAEISRKVLCTFADKEVGWQGRRVMTDQPIQLRLLRKK